MSRRPIARAARWILPLAWFSIALFNCDAIFDIAPPEIEIIEPQEGVSYFGTLPVELQVTDNREVEKVEVFLDGESVHEFTREPYMTEIDLGGISANALNVVAYDRAGNWSDASQHIISLLAVAYNTPGQAAGVFVSGGYAYVADGESGLQIIDVSNPASPILAGAYDTPGIAYDVFVTGGYAYVADRGSGLQVVDVSNPASPTLASSYDTPGGAWDVFVSGRYAYVAVGENGLLIFDISGLP